MRAELNGQIYFDTDGKGRPDRRELGIPGIAVELLNDEGEVIATAVTGRDGRYRFTQFRETGDYQVRLVLPPRLVATTATTRDVLISRGDTTVYNYNFGLRLGRLWNPAAVDNVPAFDAALRNFR